MSAGNCAGYGLLLLLIKSNIVALFVCTCFSKACLGLKSLPVETVPVLPTVLGHYGEYIFEIVPFLASSLGIEVAMDTKTICEKRSHLKKKFSVMAKHGGLHNRKFHR
jgi:hypothetical protein